MNPDRRLTIIRGLPGTGKSALANALMRASMDKHDSCSFLDINHVLYKVAVRDAGDAKGTIMLDPQKVKEVYEESRQMVDKAMSEDVPDIILVGSFLKVRHLDPFYALAAQHGYVVSVITAHSYQSNPNRLPLKSLRRMSELLEFPKTIIPADLQVAG